MSYESTNQTLSVSYRYNNDSLFNLPFYLCIFRKHVMLSYFELGLVATRLLSLLQRPKNTRPQFISLAYKIGQANIRHTRIVVTRHGFQLRNNVLQTECLPGSLCTAGFQHYVDNVDVEVVVGWLI